eukprot:tig00020927_g15976.t1
MRRSAAIGSAGVSRAFRASSHACGLLDLGAPEGRPTGSVAKASAASPGGIDLVKEFGVSEQQAKQFALYGDMMLASPTNVTAIKEIDGVYVLHFSDSLTLLPAIDELIPPPEEGPLRVIDVGTGGGLPGVALAIARPRCSVALLEATKKKTAFLDGVIAAAKLKNARTLWGRAEDCAHEERHREYYDVAVARAVAPLRTLAELCLPFVRPGGFFLAQKTRKAEGEIDAAKRALELLGGALREVRPLEVRVPLTFSDAPWFDSLGPITRARAVPLGSCSFLWAHNPPLPFAFKLPLPDPRGPSHGSGAQVPGLVKASEADGRMLVVIEKVKPTPAKYPRLPGTPKSNPL